MSKDGETGLGPINPTAIPQRKLYTGATMPAIGLGTFGSDRVGPNEVAEAVKGAAAIGYRHFDCASVYGNEAAVGASLEDIVRGGIRRDELWITSKLWNDKHGEEDVIASCQKSLADLRLDYLDLVPRALAVSRISTRPAATSRRAAPTPSPTFMRTT